MADFRNGTKRIPHHQRLFQTLKNEIREGKYLEGSYLPSENELCAKFGVTRPTVRQALANLQQEGYILRLHGKGSMVRATPMGIGILSVASTSQGFGKHTLKTSILKPLETCPCPTFLNFPFTEEEVENSFYKLERKRIVEKVPVIYEITYLPCQAVPGLDAYSLENASLFQLLEKQYQISILGGQQHLSASTANSLVAKLLGIKEGAPLLHLDRRLTTNLADQYIYSSVFSNTTRFHLTGSF